MCLIGCCTFCSGHADIVKGSSLKAEDGAWKCLWARIGAGVPAARMQGCRVLGQEEVDHSIHDQLLATGVLRGGLGDNAGDCHPHEDVAGRQEPGKWHCWTLSNGTDKVGTKLTC